MKNLTILYFILIMLTSCTDYNIATYSKKPIANSGEVVEEIILADADTIFKLKIDADSGWFNYWQSPNLNLGVSLERRQDNKFKTYQIVYCTTENTATIPQHSAYLPNNGKFNNYDFKHVGTYSSYHITYVQNKDHWSLSDNSLIDKDRINHIYKSMIRDNSPGLHPVKITFIKNICNYDSSYQYTYTYNW